MAIFYCQMSVVSRSSGRSAVAAVAYRSAERLTNERDGLTHDYSRRDGVEHSEIVLPEGVKAEWAQDRSALWNAAEAVEKRVDARVAREFVLALPHELNAEKRLELTREFAQDLADRYGAAVDFAIHAPHSASDVRNHHAHVLMTTRQVNEQGFGAKTYLELANKELLPRDLPTTQMQLVDIRRSWEQMANRELAEAGLDVRIDHRSHSERGIEIEPTEHMGVHATQMQRKGMSLSRSRLDEDAAKRNADLIREKPEQVLTLISNEKSVFDRHDIARTLHRYINGDPQEFQNAFASVLASKSLVELQGERSDPETGEVSLARYSTREMVETEGAMARSADMLQRARSHDVDRHHVDQSIEKQDRAIQASVGYHSAQAGPAPGLSDEQRRAIQHITGPERIAAVVGFAGAGKSTMLDAAREAWEAQGYTVHGAALSGKAAEGLEEASGIQSRTLASWDINWQNEKRQLGRGDVFVIDEAGMVGSRQLARFIGEAEQRGAKIVLVGDHEQLQAIGAGAPFRAIAEQIGHVELTDIRRQRKDWQRDASVAFATHKTAEGLAAYRDNGNIHFEAGRDETRAAIVRDYLADREQRPDGSRVAMAHRRVDVRAINDGIRSELQDRGELARVRDGGGPEGQGIAGEQERPQAFTYQTDDGKRDFAEGDRIVFLQNDRDLGVKNGMLGRVAAVEPNAIHVELDGKSAEPGSRPGFVRIDINAYQSFDHGYATTIHKNQGATVDRAFVLASGTMDRHLTYVAMTRHRDDVQLYAAKDEFAGRSAGKLVEHGVAPYERKAGNRDSYFVTLENDQGQRHTTWGVGLEQAMKQAAPEIGARIALEHAGSETVRLTNGQTAERNSWKVQDAGELAYEQLEGRLSRSGAKETTLDYTRDFAERRGIAEQFGVRSEIELAPAQKLGQENSSRTAHPVREVQDRSISERSAYEERTASRADPDPRGEGITPDQQPQRRSMFSGLKLGRGTSGEPKPAQERVEGGEDRAQPKASKRSMFAGLKLNADRSTSPERNEGSEKQRAAPERDALTDRIQPSGFEQSVDRFARAWTAMDKMDGQGLPVLESQKTEFRQASLGLDQQRPGASSLMISAMQYDPQTGRAMTELSGRERVGELVAGMDRERAAQADPTIRADRLINRWQELQEERQSLRGWQHDDARGKVEGQMRQVTGAIERDPPVESIVRSRAQEIGIEHVGQGQNIASAMEQQLSRGRSQGLER
ncbi:Ti-type conjugative transfer relaxase TraA [Agrobacterium vitis]|uniref:Ti-type conjugative transfer relaxase TraA n=1 Tax=Agrobacterium vitis TaxID=373 RepID=A0ABW9TNE9_AGRVI|nr:Ti-type conjugative transfer relaxase TraA [Agrobacterium vitis]MUO45426.1 Ti-type conjugative transfer relaxase TraA [Agrobacterium vitis]